MTREVQNTHFSINLNQFTLSILLWRTQYLVTNVKVFSNFNELISRKNKKGRYQNSISL